MTREVATLALHPRRPCSTHREPRWLAVGTVRLVVSLLLGMTLLSFRPPPSAFAAGVVGTGTPGSCTEAALDAALTGGGSVTFNCGASPVTITITSVKTITVSTNIDGDGRITISK